MRKLCPFKLIGGQKGYVSSDFILCNNAACAWWSEEEGECAVLVIAKYLYPIWRKEE